MRTSVNRLVRIGIVAAIAAIAALPLLPATAGAVEAPSTLGPCTFTVVPNPVPTPPGFPADVTVTVTVPQTGVTVTVFVNGVANQSVIANTTTVVFTVHLTAASNISVNYFLDGGNAYATGCTSGGSLTVLVDAAQAARAQALAFTGSNNTHSFVLIGIAALVVGLVLTVGARRRSRISS